MDAEAKAVAETRRADAAEAKAQRVSVTARGAAEELRKSWADIQTKYETQVAALRVEKARVEGACEQALTEKEKLQLWITDHMEASKERLLNGHEAVAASERARAEVQAQNVELGREILSLQEQITALERRNLQRQHTVASARDRERASVDAKIVQLHAQMEAAQAASCASRDALEAEKQKKIEAERQAAEEIATMRIVQIEHTRMLHEQREAYEAAIHEATSQIQSEPGLCRQGGQGCF
jgi:hypothetical protein